MLNLEFYVDLGNVKVRVKYRIKVTLGLGFYQVSASLITV